MMRGEEISQDRILWVNVLLRAIEDATAPRRPQKDRYAQAEIDAQREEARAWFDLDNLDFLEVCTLAGLDPEATYEKAMAAIRHADQQPVHDRRGQTYSHDGITLTIGQWAQRTGIPVGVLYARIKQQGLSIEQALTMPYQPRKAAASPAPQPARTTINRMVDGFRASKGPAFGFGNIGRTLPI